MEIKININRGGFLKDAEYSFYFLSIMKEYENSFDDLGILILEVEEDLLSLNSSKEWFLFDKEKLTLTIVFTEQAFFSKRGRELPSPQSVFQRLKTQMDIAVEKYMKIVGINL